MHRVRQEVHHIRNGGIHARHGGEKERLPPGVFRAKGQTGHRQGVREASRGNAADRQSGVRHRKARGKPSGSGDNFRRDRQHGHGRTERDRRRGIRALCRRAQAVQGHQQLAQRDQRSAQTKIAEQAIKHFPAQAGIFLCSHRTSSPVHTYIAE